MLTLIYCFSPTCRWCKNFDNNYYNQLAEKMKEMFIEIRRINSQDLTKVEYENIKKLIRWTPIFILVNIDKSNKIKETAIFNGRIQNDIPIHKNDRPTTAKDIATWVSEQLRTNLTFLPQNKKK